MANLHNPVKAIRAKCLRCTCDQPVEVDKCPITDCPLYPFRYGKNPYRAKREMGDEERARRAEIARTNIARAHAALEQQRHVENSDG